MIWHAGSAKSPYTLICTRLGEASPTDIQIYTETIDYCRTISMNSMSDRLKAVLEGDGPMTGY